MSVVDKTIHDFITTMTSNTGNLLFFESQLKLSSDVNRRLFINSQDIMDLIKEIGMACKADQEIVEVGIVFNRKRSNIYIKEDPYMERHVAILLSSSLTENYIYFYNRSGNNFNRELKTSKEIYTNIRNILISYYPSLGSILKER